MRSIMLLACVACCGWAGPVQGESGVGVNEPNPSLPQETAGDLPPQTSSGFPYRPAPGWFAGIEGAVFSSRVTPVNLFPMGESEAEPVPNLGVVPSPRATFGYHFLRGNALLASYRFLTTSADDTSYGQNHSSLTFQTLDLDYQGRIRGPWLSFTAQWQTGVRLIDARYDTRTVNSQVSGQTSEHFLGIGPHLGLNLAWFVPHTGLSFFGRGDLGVIFGSSRNASVSHYSPQPADWGYWATDITPVIMGPTDMSSSGSSRPAFLSMRAEVGIGWTPPTCRWMRFEGGYQVEDFDWDGRLFRNVGPFLRYEVGF